MPWPPSPHMPPCAQGYFEQYEKNETGKRRRRRQPTSDMQKEKRQKIQLRALLGVFVALALSICPACQAVCEVGDIAGCRACSFTQVATQRDGTAVVASGGGVGVAVVDEVLCEAVAGCGSLCAVLYHVVDGLVGVV